LSFEMNKLTILFATGLLVVAASAEAGSKCNGRATTNRSVRGTHVLTIFVAHPADKDIVDTAVAAGSFKTLVTEIEASNGVIHVIDSVMLP